MNSPIVTLTTDWGSCDFFAGMVKGRLCCYIPEVRVVDICHGVQAFDHRQTAFVLEQACLGFPEGTIHIIDVDSVAKLDEEFVVVLYHGQYYICTDNGIPYVVFGDRYTQAVYIHLPQESDTYTFAAYDLFCKVAGMIAHGTPLEEIGPEVEQLKPTYLLSPIERPNGVDLHIAYFDSYGNAYLDITYEEFERLRNHRKFALHIREHTITAIGYSYYDRSSVGSVRCSLLLLVSATGRLEIALCSAKAQQLLGLRLNKLVVVDFL